MDSKVRIKTLLIATLALSSLALCQASAQQPISGTMKDTASGTSYIVTITPVVTTPPPVDTHPVVDPPPVDPPQQVGTIPLSWDAPQFANVSRISPTKVAAGAVLENKSIETHAEPASIQMGSNSTLRNVRVGKGVREGVRIGSGKYTIEGSWLEAKGSGDDHADIIQSYAGPSGGGPMDLTVRNSTIRGYDVAANAGLFVADKVYGKVTLDNVVFWGAPIGLALYSDVKTIDVYAKDLCFVGPFRWRPIDFRNAGGRVVVKQWENVRNCTIDAAGNLVKGTAIPQPN